MKQTIKTDIVNTLEMLYDSCHLTRDNVNTGVCKLLAKHLGEDYDSVYNTKVSIKSLGNREFIVDVEIKEK